MIDREFSDVVRKTLRKQGWRVKTGAGSELSATREIFQIEVLLGPEYYDRRFPVVPIIYQNKLRRMSLMAGGRSILLVLRDRTTLPYFEIGAPSYISILHLSQLHFLEHLTVTNLLAPEDDEKSHWAIEFGKKCPRIKRELAKTDLVKEGWFKRFLGG